MMRQSFGSDFLIDKDNLVGINLGADFTAEHEWGIRETEEYFQVDSSKVGLARYKTSKLTDSDAELEWYGGTTYAGFWFKENYFKKETPTKWGGRSKPVFGKERKLYTAWDSKGFCAFRKHGDDDSKEDVAKLKEIFKALQDGNAAIWLGGGGPYQRSGLCIGIADKIPEHVIKLWEEHHNG